MIYIIVFILSIIADAFILTTLHLCDAVILTLGISSCVIGLFVLLCILTKIKNTIEQQAKNKYELDEYRKDKEAYKRELKEYKECVEHVFLECRDFEKELMQNVMDSNLIAAALEKNTYPQAVMTYADELGKLIHRINEVDRNINAVRKRMLARQESNIFTYGWFIPKNLRI